MAKHSHVQTEQNASSHYSNSAAHPVELDRVGDWYPHEWFDSERLQKAPSYLQASANFTATVNDMVHGLTVCMEMLEADDNAQDGSMPPVFSVSQRGAIIRMCITAMHRIGEQADTMLLYTSSELDLHEAAHE